MVPRNMRRNLFKDTCLNIFLRLSRTWRSCSRVFQTPGELSSFRGLPAGHSIHRSHRPSLPGPSGDGQPSFRPLQPTFQGQQTDGILSKAGLQGRRSIRLPRLESRSVHTDRHPLERMFLHPHQPLDRFRKRRVGLQHDVRRRRR